MSKFELFIASWMRRNQYTKWQFWDWFGSLAFEQQQRVIS